MSDPATSISELQFRELRSEHFSALTTFMEENNVDAVVRTFRPFPLNAETAREIVSGERRDRFYGAFLTDGRIVGLSMLRGWDEGYTVPSFGIMIDHRFHGFGIGSRLTDFTLQQASSLDCARVRLSVFASNVVAVQLYLSRGFVIDSREPVKLDGAEDERIVMSRDLQP